jgi:peroxiredoxin
MDKIKEFKEKYGLGFPMLSDRECGVVESYGAAIKLPFVGTFANRLGGGREET